MSEDDQGSGETDWWYYFLLSFVTGLVMLRAIFWLPPP